MCTDTTINGGPGAPRLDQRPQLGLEPIGGRRWSIERGVPRAGPALGELH